MAAVRAIRLAVSLSEMIAQVPTKVKYSTPKARNCVLWDKGCEVDPWINDIYAEAYPAQPGVICVPGVSVLTLAHDLKEDIVLENHLLES